MNLDYIRHLFFAIISVKKKQLQYSVISISYEYKLYVGTTETAVELQICSWALELENNKAN